MRKFLCSLLMSSLILSASFHLKAFDIIAHRGASGYLPEHTTEAAVLAFMQGADFIEQDLVSTRDKHLIVLHDIHLETVTDVEQRFPDRAREDGRWYVIDFDLEELLTLQVHERTDKNGKQVFPNRYKGNSLFKIATFEQQIELIKELNRVFENDVGFYPEIKAPEFHLQHEIDITALVMQVLNKHGLNSRDANIYVQSFYPPSLKRIRDEFQSNIKLVQLIAEDSWSESSVNYSEMMTAEGIKAIASYADGIGPWIPQILDENLNAKSLLEYAKTEGLSIHPFTFREDATSYDVDAITLFSAIKSAGASGLFTDQVLPYMLESPVDTADLSAQ